MASEYYDQLNMALLSSHTVFNYAMYLSLLNYWFYPPPSRALLVLDEIHRLEEEVVKFTEVSISKRHYIQYIPDFEIPDYGFDIERWIGFLNELVDRIDSIIKAKIKRTILYH